MSEALTLDPANGTVSHVSGKVLAGDEEQVASRRLRVVNLI